MSDKMKLQVNGQEAIKLETSDVTAVRVLAYCTACAGAGTVQHPLWTEFFEEHGAYTTQTAQKWFADKGYGFTPAENIDCLECGGARMVETWVGIVTFTQMLGCA